LIEGKKIMGAKIIKFLLRAIGAVLITREKNGPGWLTIVGDHGCLSGSYAAARSEAEWFCRDAILQFLPADAAERYRARLAIERARLMAEIHRLMGVAP
jgi:hypothetical protein